jgi:hypothetical protein
MAEDDLTPLLLIGGVAAVYLMTRPKPNPNKPAVGKKPPSTESQVCAAGVGLAGGSANQAAAAGLFCDKVLPYVVDGLKYLGDKANDLNVAVGTNILKAPGVTPIIRGLEGGYGGGKYVLDHPGGTIRTLFGFGAGGRRSTPEEAAAAREQAGVTGCGGWKGDCPPVAGAQTAGPGYPTGKPMGFR